jgi:hypothetical protein
MLLRAQRWPGLLVRYSRADKGSFVIHVTRVMDMDLDSYGCECAAHPRTASARLGRRVPEEAALHQVQVAGIEIESPFFDFVRWPGS